MIEVKFFCPHCGNKLLVGEAAFGKSINCPHCEKAIVAPIGRLTGETSAPRGESKSDHAVADVLSQQQELLNSALKEQEHRLKDINRQLADCQATLAGTETILTEKRSQLKKVTDDHEAKKLEVARSETELNSVKARTLDELKAAQDKERRLKELDARIAERASQCTELDHHIDAVNRSIAEANTRLKDIRDAESEALTRFRSAEYQYFLTYIKPHLPPSFRSAATEHEEQLSRAACGQELSQNSALHSGTDLHAFTQSGKRLTGRTESGLSTDSTPASKCEEIKTEAVRASPPSEITPAKQPGLAPVPAPQSTVPAQPRCKVCDRGFLQQTSVYRTSNPIAIMGYVLMIPSAVVLGFLALLALMALVKGDTDDSAAVALFGIGVWLVVAFICLPTFIVGFLLRMKKSLLKCDTCGSAVSQQ